TGKPEERNECEAEEDRAHLQLTRMAVHEGDPLRVRIVEIRLFPGDEERREEEPHEKDSRARREPLPVPPSHAYLLEVCDTKNHPPGSGRCPPSDLRPSPAKKAQASAAPAA